MTMSMYRNILKPPDIPDICHVLSNRGHRYHIAVAHIELI